MNTAARNTCAQAFAQTHFLFLLGKNQGVGLFGHLVRKQQTVFPMATPFSIHPSNVSVLLLRLLASDHGARFTLGTSVRSCCEQEPPKRMLRSEVWVKLERLDSFP